MVTRNSNEDACAEIDQAFPLHVCITCHYQKALRLACTILLFKLQLPRRLVLLRKV
jgi:hypothetical protein